MAFSQWQSLDPTLAEVRQALTEAFAAADWHAPFEDEIREALLGLEPPAGSVSWPGLEIEGRPQSRVTCVWWTDTIGRRHWYVEADQYPQGGEPMSNWRCRFGVPEHPLWVLAHRHALRVGAPPGTLLVLCDCGEVGTPESIGWMGTTCGPCHDRLAEGGWRRPRAQAYQPHRSSVSGLAFLKDGRIASCGYRDTSPCVVEPATGYLERFHLGQEGGSTDLEMLPDDRVVLVTGLRTVVCLDVGSMAVAWRSDIAGEVMGLSVSPRGDRIAVDTVGGVLTQAYLLNTADGTATSLSGDASDYAWSFDAEILYAFDNAADAVTEIDPTTGEANVTDLAFTDPVASNCYSMRCSPVARLLACGGDDGQVRLGDPESGRWLWVGEVPSVLVTRLAFAPDGRTLVSDHGDAIVFWQVDTGDLVGRVQIPGYHVSAMAFSPDGETLAVGDAQGVVRLLPWRRLL